MKFSLAAIAATLFKSTATAVQSSWEGNLNMKMYTGNNCTDGSFVGTDVATSLAALPDGSLCETDIMGEQTYYSKLKVSCDHIGDNPDRPVVIDNYMCSDSACSNCSDTAVASGWQSQGDIALMLNEKTTDGTCQVINVIETNNLDQLNNTNLELVSSNATDSSARYEPPDQAMGYAEILIGNTCLSDYIDIEAPVKIQVECPPSTSPGGSNITVDGSSAASSVRGFYLSMFAIAGLSTVIFSV